MQENSRIQGHLFGCVQRACLGHDICLHQGAAARVHAAGDYGSAVHARLSGAAHRGKGPHAPQKRWHEGLFALAGLSGVTLYFLMENIALTYISASLVGVIVAAAPLFTALIAAVVLHEKLSKWFFFGFVCAMAGVALVSLAGVSELHFSPIGALLGVGAALVWGVYSVLVRQLGHMGYRTIPLT